MVTCCLENELSHMFYEFGLLMKINHNSIWEHKKPTISTTSQYIAIQWVEYMKVEERLHKCNSTTCFKKVEYAITFNSWL